MDSHSGHRAATRERETETETEGKFCSEGAEGRAGESSVDGAGPVLLLFPLNIIKP